MSHKNIFLCIHGHFYQPPRENPWIEQIEIQKSAYPFHDWNERIHRECYFPNARARVLDEKGNITDIVNNFEWLNFNFGPTLLSWLSEHHPDTYHKILEADQLGLAARHGFGNAIAQAYNHMILPLANERDKTTQILWGISDFEFRFKRKPKAMWIPETACDEATLEALFDHGMKFVILEPHQASAVRVTGTQEWKSVSGGHVDPKHSYRYFLKNRSGQHIDIFFYDGPISKGVGFGDLLSDAKHFMNRLETAMVKRDEAQLIHIATDGETFGHHKVFGDRALAYLVSNEALKRGYQITNYEQFLEQFPSRYEVALNFGENDEGTSWSCSHGIKRWRDHCGCRGDGPAEWTQHWRKPLREALDWLRDELVPIFEQYGSPLLKDVWQARNDYIQVILDRSDKSLWKFFESHAAKVLEAGELIQCLKLLEMQRHAMLMYTSCGWFFTELSGIETVQIMQYASRAIELAENVSGKSLEAEFLNRLENAKSNIPAFKDGRGVYEKFVKPSRINIPHVASFYGIHSALEEYDRKHFDFYCFKISVTHQRKESYGDLVLNFGSMQIVSRITLESEELAFAVLQFGTYDFRCSVKPKSEIEDFDETEKHLFNVFHHVDIVEMMRELDRMFGKEYYSLKQVPLEWRVKIISMLTKESIDKINKAYDQLYEDNRRMNEMYRSINLPIPDEIQYAVDHTLRRRFMMAIQELAHGHYDSKKTYRLYKLIDIANGLNIQINKTEIAGFLSNELAEKTKNLLTNLSEVHVVECLNIQKIAKKMNIELDEIAAQDNLFNLLTRLEENSQELSQLSDVLVGYILKLSSAVGIDPKRFKKAFD